jgi:hypothetical protein
MNTDNCTPLPSDDSHRGSGDEWQAYRYVLGEMSTDEAAAYEQLLDVDQEARELVARATRTITGFYRAAAIDSSRSRTAVAPIADKTTEGGGEHSRRRWRLAGLTAAVALLVAAAMHLISPRGLHHLNDLSVVDSVDDVAGHLVAIWSERLADSALEPGTTEATASERADVPLSSDAEEGRPTAAMAENAPAVSVAASEQMAADEQNVPGWLIAALSAGDRHGPEPLPSEVREN